MQKDIIHPNQTNMVSGRSIFNNLYLVWDLLKLIHRDGLSFTLLSLNQKKAFDRMDHRYLTGIGGIHLQSPLHAVSLGGVVHLHRVYVPAQLDADGAHPIQVGSASRLPAERPALHLCL